jgi:hypothetical protein
VSATVGTLALLALVGTLGLAFIQKLIVDEAIGWIPHITRAIVSAAVRRLPTEHRRRYREEWLAESDALSDRKLTALAHALRLLLGAASMRDALASPDSNLAGRREEPTGVLDTVLVSLQPLRQRRNGPLVEWPEVLELMADDALVLVDADLRPAENRFTALLEPSPLKPEFVALLRGETPRVGSEVGHAVSEGNPGPTEVVLPSPYEEPASPPPKRADRPRRFAPYAFGDPEWRVAALTAAERRQAAPFVYSILENTPLTAHWPSSVRGSLLEAVERYDSTPRRARQAAQADDAVRLGVVLQAWQTEREMTVRRLPRGEAT